MTLDHLAIATAGPDARALFERLLDAAPYRTETVEEQGVTTVFFGDGGRPGAAPKVELLEALGPDSPVGRFLGSHGPGLHHVAFEVPNLARELARVAALGVRVLGEPRAGADGMTIAFLHPKDTGGVLVELCARARAPRETVFVDGPDGRLAVHVSGDGPPMLVMHGALGATALETDRLVRHWERRFRVLALDLRGHGRSDPMTRTPTWGDFVADALAVLDHFAVARARVFGFSMGGGIALGLAAQHPERVDRLAVHGVNVRWTPAEVEAMVRPMEPARLRAKQPFWAQRLDDVHGADWGALAEHVGAFTTALPDCWMPVGLTNAITAHSLISHGDADSFFGLHHPLALRAEIPHARLWVVPGLDHPIQGVDAAAFARLVGDHLAG